MSDADEASDPDDELESGETTLAAVAAPPMTIAADAPVNTVIDQRLGLES